MKKRGILNPALCALIAELGSGEELLIVDAAFPMPDDVLVVDLTLTAGIPRFLEVLKAVEDELVIESVVVPQEMSEYHPLIHDEVVNLFGESEVEEVSHREFLESSSQAKGLIRSGEFSPYACIKLICGSAF